MILHDLRSCCNSVLSGGNSMSGRMTTCLMRYGLLVLRDGKKEMWEPIRSETPTKSDDRDACAR